MREGWRESTFAEIAAERGLAGGPFGSNLGRKDYVPSGIPVLRGQNLSTGRFVDYSDCVFVTNEKLRSTLVRNTAEPGDVVFTQRGTLGQVAVVPQGPFEIAVISQSQMRLRVSLTVADPWFVFYFSTSPAFLEQLGNRAIVTGVPHINLGILSNMRVPLPPLAEQRRIAGVLGALDDLIDTNQRLVSHVKRLSAEAYARAVLESVGVTSLGEVAGINPDAVKPRATSELIRYLDIAALSDGGADAPRSMSWADAPSRARRLAQDDDILWSTVRPNRRGHAILHNSPENLVVSTGIAVLRAKEIGFAELYAATDRSEFVDFLMTRAEGSAYPAVRPDDFAAAPILRLPESVSEAFEASIGHLWHAAGALIGESDQLRRTRDELLPLLMSGAVSPAEVVVAS